MRVGVPTLTGDDALITSGGFNSHTAIAATTTGGFRNGNNRAEPACFMRLHRKSVPPHMSHSRTHGTFEKKRLCVPLLVSHVHVSLQQWVQSGNNTGTHHCYIHTNTDKTHDAAHTPAKPVAGTVAASHREIPSGSTHSTAGKD